MAEERAVASPTPVEVALKGLCPHCGARTLFAGWVRFADRCGGCGLEFSRFNVGDGPAAFLTLLLGAVIVTLAIVLELTMHPPWWVHVLLWVPATAAAVLAALRVSKGALIALEYRNRAAEARSGDVR